MDQDVINGLVAARSTRERARARFREQLVHAYESGLPQREIARAMGVTQPAVSQMLHAERARRMSLQGPVRVKVDRHRTEIIDIARQHSARHLRIFGSVAEGRDTVDSDLDLLVSLPRTAGMLDVASLGDALADALGAPVDVVAEHMVKRDQLAALKRRAIPL